MTTFAIDCPCGRRVSISFKHQHVKGRRCPECERWLEIRLRDHGEVGLAFVDGDPIPEQCAVSRADPIMAAEVERLR